MRPKNLDKSKTADFQSDTFEFDVAERIPLSLLLAKQIDRINNLFCTQPVLIGQALIALDALMTPLLNYDYQARLEYLRKWYIKKRKEYRDNPDDLAELDFDYATEKLKIIYLLIADKNFYPERKIEFDIDEGEIPENDDSNTTSSSKYTGPTPAEE